MVSNLEMEGSGFYMHCTNQCGWYAEPPCKLDLHACLLPFCLFEERTLKSFQPHWRLGTTKYLWEKISRRLKNNKKPQAWHSEASRTIELRVVIRYFEVFFNDNVTCVEAMTIGKYIKAARNSSTVGNIHVFTFICFLQTTNFMLKTTCFYERLRHRRFCLM